ncbi:MAG: hypothetical protein QGI93_13155 [Planctomycetota bacterium]|nr:hypothetical protein [Planctomycetota bacterium]
MLRRQSHRNSQPGHSARALALAGLATAAAGVIFWSLFETRATPALAAARPLAQENLGPRHGPLLSAEVIVETARSERAPIQLTSVGKAAPAVPALRNPMDPFRAFLSGWDRPNPISEPRVAELEALTDSLSPEDLRRLCGLALDHLKDDDAYMNAHRARNVLEILGAANNPTLRPLLVDCLDSPDVQQRSIVASFLRASDMTAENEMLLAAAKDLRDDGIPKAHKSLTFKGHPEGWDWGKHNLPHDLHNARQAARMLIGEGSRAWPHVLKCLHASDPQERFLAAVILARTRCPDNLDLTVTVLVTHLKDNDWKGDATIAGRALHELDEAALPHLRRLQSIADPQGRRLVRLAIEEIEEPSANASEAYERAQKIASSAEGKPLAVWRFAPDTLDGLVRR